MSNPKRLHPATILFHFVKGIKNTIFVMVLAFASLIDGKLLYAILAILLIATIIAVHSILSWRRFTYRVENEELRLEYGIFVRKKRYISKNRIQSIDLTQNILHRLVRLVKVEIETAGTGAEAEASLIAVTLSEGEALRAELKSLHASNVEEQEEEKSFPFKKISKNQLLFAGATSGSIGVLLAIAGFVFSEIERFIPTNFYDSAYNWVVGLGIMIIALFVVVTLLLLWLLGIVGTVIKYWNFTITKHDKDIVITRGLLEKKQTTIPLKRIQAVGYVEGIFRQPFGYATVIAEIAGGTNEKGEEFSTILFPFLKVNQVTPFLQRFLPEYVGDMEELQTLPKRASKYYIIRTAFPMLVLGIAVVFLLPQFLWIPSVLFVLSVLLGVLRFKDTGYLLENNKLIVRYRIFNRVTMTLYQKRIQAFNTKRNWFHRRESLATLKLSIIGKMGLGKHFTIKELDEEDVDKIADWYSYRKRG